MDTKKVAIIMGSDSDYPVVKNAETILKKMDIPYVVRIMSAHRTPEAVVEFTENARKNNFAVIIAAAGKAAHLAGVIAAHTTLPVIGIPIKSSAFGGMDALLSTVQMPKGIPVATVAVDGAENAAILAAEMMAIYNSPLEKKLEQMRIEMAEDVLAKDRELEAKNEF